MSGLRDYWMGVNPTSPEEQEKRRLEEQARTQERVATSGSLSLRDYWMGNKPAVAPEMDAPAPVAEAPVEEQVAPVMSPVATGPESPELLSALGAAQPINQDALILGTQMQDDLIRRLNLEMLVRKAEEAGLVPIQQEGMMQDLAGQLPAPAPTEEQILAAQMMEAMNPVQMDTGPAAPPRPDAQVAPARPAELKRTHDPGAMDEALAREERIAGYEGDDPVSRIVKSTVGSVVDSPVALVQNVVGKAVSVLPDELEATFRAGVEEYMSSDRGLAGKIGGVTADFVLPMVEFGVVKAGAVKLATTLAKIGAPARVVQAARIAASDPGALLADGNQAGAFLALLREEAPFILGDIIGGATPRETFVNAMTGVAIGRAFEATPIGRAMAGDLANEAAFKGVDAPRPEPDVPEPDVRGGVDATPEPRVESGTPEPDLGPRLVSGPEGDQGELLPDRLEGEPVEPEPFDPSFDAAERVYESGTGVGDGLIGTLINDYDGSLDQTLDVLGSVDWKNEPGYRARAAHVTAYTKSENSHALNLAIGELSGTIKAGSLKRFLTKAVNDGYMPPDDARKIYDTFEAANRSAMELKAQRPKQPANSFDAAERAYESRTGVGDGLTDAEFDYIAREADALNAPVRPEEDVPALPDIQGFRTAQDISRNMLRSDPGDPVSARKAIESGVADDMDATELRHTLGFQAVEDVMDDVARTSLGRAIRSKLRVAGDVSRRVFRKHLEESNILKGRMFATNEIATRVAEKLAAKHGIQAVTDLGGLPPEVRRDMEIAVASTRGWLPTMSIDKEIFDDLRKLRIESNLLSSQMRKENLIHGQLLASISERGSTYLARGYRMFKQGDDWGPDAQRTNTLINWAQHTLGLDTAGAEEFAFRLRQSKDLGEALDQINREGRALERAQLRTPTGKKAAGSLEALSGYVPQNIRSEIERLVGGGAKTNKLIDDFIGRTDMDEQKIIQKLEGVRQRAMDDAANPQYTGKKTAAQLKFEIDKAEELIDTLWRRIEIPEPVRKFLGEEDNPLIRIVDTLERQGQIVAGARLAQKVVDVGIEKGTVKTARQIIDEGGDPDNYIQIGSKDFKLVTMLPEHMEKSDLYLERDVYDALNDRFVNIREQGKGWKFFMGLNHLLKGNLTFRNPGTHGRNFFGAKMFESATGLARPDNLPDQLRRLSESMRSAKLASSLSSGKLSDTDLKEVRLLIEMGLIDKSVFERGFADNLKELADNAGGDVGTWATQLRQRALDNNTVVNTLKKWDNAAREAYRAEDDVARIVVYYGEADEMANAAARGVDAKTFNKVYGTDITDASDPMQVKKVAASIANDTYPNYEMLSRGVQDLRRNPVLSSFPSFAAEVLRTSTNNFKFAARELGTPGLRGRGVKRLYGLVQTAMAPVAFSKAMALRTGMSKEEHDALRRDQGDYQKYNTIVPLWRNADGSINYLDLGYMEPHGLIRSSWNALVDGLQREGFMDEAGSLSRALGQAFNELADPFAQQEIIFGAFMELVNNQDKWGQKVLDSDEWQKDLARHLAKRFEPGVSKPIRRVVGAFQGKMATNLTTPRPWMEAGEFVGFRIRQSNPRKEYDWRLGRTRDMLLGADDDLIRLIRNPNDVSEARLRDAYEKYEDRRKRAILDGGIATMDTRYRGNTEPEIEHALRSMGLDKEERESMRLGVYVPKKFGPTFQERLKTDFVRQALSAEDASMLWNRVESRIQFLRQLSAESRAEGVQEYRWER